MGLKVIILFTFSLQSYSNGWQVNRQHQQLRKQRSSHRASYFHHVVSSSFLTSSSQSSSSLLSSVEESLIVDAEKSDINFATTARETIIEDKYQNDLPGDDNTLHQNYQDEQHQNQQKQQNSSSNQHLLHHPNYPEQHHSHSRQKEEKRISSSPLPLSSSSSTTLEIEGPLPATISSTTTSTRRTSDEGGPRTRRWKQENSRREFLRQATILLGGAVTGGSVIKHAVFDAPPNKQSLSRANWTLVAQETNINMTVECSMRCVSLNKTTFQKVETMKVPSWIPSFLQPKPKVIKNISDHELLTAAIIAGSTVEMTRTLLLYPLLTLKNRVQTDIGTRIRTRKKGLHLKRRLQVVQLNARRHMEEGALYAGIIPSLLVSVPATGVYFGVRDVVKRTISPLPIGDIPAALVSAFVGDVVSLIIRTPIDTLALRERVVAGQQSRDKDPAVEAKIGDWFKESIERLPAVILTDIPYLLSRIALNRALMHGSTDMTRYELTAIATALLMAFLTTPFDVARTRILIDSDDNPSNGIDGGSGEGLVRTFKTIYEEGDDGISNLFRGWSERVLYLGVGRAWIEPLQLIGYMAIRDAILLEWFD